MKKFIVFLLCIISINSFSQPKKLDIENPIPFSSLAKEIKFEKWVFSYVQDNRVWSRYYKITPAGLNSAIYDIIEYLKKYEIDSDDTISNKSFGLKDLEGVVEYHSTIQRGYGAIEKSWLIRENKDYYVLTISCVEGFYSIIVIEIK